MTYENYPYYENDGDEPTDAEKLAMTEEFWGAVGETFKFLAAKFEEIEKELEKNIADTDANLDSLKKMIETYELEDMWDRGDHG